MQFLQMNYKDYLPERLHTGIITDIPYRNCIKNVLNEENFDVNQFWKKCNEITIENSYVITFTNLMNLFDLRLSCEQFGYKFITYQIWNKQPIRTWISWGLPLKTHEIIAYFTKGNFKFDFRDGSVKSKYNRKSFGEELKSTSENKNEVSYGMYEDIITIHKPKSKIHPTIKPEEFSTMFFNIVKNDNEKFVLDPFCGSGNLLKAFDNSIGIDLKNWME